MDGLITIKRQLLLRRLLCYIVLSRSAYFEQYNILENAGSVDSCDFITVSKDLFEQASMKENAGIGKKMFTPLYQKTDASEQTPHPWNLRSYRTKHY